MEAATTTEPQHRQALRRANAVRLQSSALRAPIRRMPKAEAYLRLAELLDDPPEPIQRTRVDLLLRDLPRWGHTRTTLTLSRLGIHPLRYVGPRCGTKAGYRALSDRQRHALAEELRGRASEA